MNPIELLAPLTGWVAPLDEVPDPVFAQRMLGDGVAIDPTGTNLHAPCAGEIVKVAPTRHAVTLRADGGAEMLMHIGVDTVAMGGEGFTAHVRDGQQVAAGDLLLSFDLDLLAQRAPSLLSPVIVVNGEAFTVVRAQTGRVLRVGEPFMQIAATGAGGPAPTAAAGETASRTLAVPLAHGIHARPAGLIAAEAKRFGGRLTIVAKGREADARSPVALMALGLTQGEAITITAAGAGAQKAVAVLAELMAGLTEAPAATPIPPPTRAPAREGCLTGVTAAPGIAIGPAAHVAAALVDLAEISEGVEAEGLKLEAALAAVRGRLADQARHGGAAAGAILAAHLAILDDAGLIEDAQAAIGRGAPAGAAWRAAVGQRTAALRAVADPRIAARADDLVDLENQVLRALAGESVAGRALPEGAIVVAQELLPSQFLALDPARLAGLVIGGGGPTSHVAILAASMNLPALVAAGPGVADIAEGAMLILDADAGLVRLAPDDDALAEARARLAARTERRAAARASSGGDARTADGTRIEVFANLASVEDARAAVDAGAEGCGLLRTEFLFLHRAAAPDEDEQHRQYQAIAQALAGRPLIIRTLDIGADKPAPYLDLPAEENPALGLRGVRVSLARPDLLATQLRAILRVAPAGQCRIMAPMVASLAELTAVRAILQAEAAAMGVAKPPELGVMIETPAAAVTADLLACEADFLSIGTNDLSQYALAMDRGDGRLAAQVDALHPAVLRLIETAVAGAATHGRPVGVCGGLASDLAAAPILIGLGVTELSATPAMISELKARVRGLELAACRELARRAVGLASAAQVRELAREAS